MLRLVFFWGLLSLAQAPLCRQSLARKNMPPAVPRFSAALSPPTGPGISSTDDWESERAARPRELSQWLWPEKRLVPRARLGVRLRRTYICSRIPSQAGS
ncbi:hypothetical protein GGR56DRAFT_621524 [Xylariaceae sp. FL0804]|nr:hypothetical protein GGR56DRAFT_621524 [Xylariaceae sp. FL0804]